MSWRTLVVRSLVLGLWGIGGSVSCRMGGNEEAVRSEWVARRGAGFSKEEDAARRAGILAKARERLESSRWGEVLGPFAGPEYGGRIYVGPDGVFGYSITAGGSPDELIEWYRRQRGEGYQPRRIAGMCRPHLAEVPEGARTVAYWHTHPNSGGFSEEDRRYAREMRMPLYLIRNSRWPAQGWVLERVFPSGQEEVVLERFGE